MRRIILLALAGAGLLFGLQSQSTRGQTAVTPTPIPTSTPIPPPPPTPPPVTPTPHPGPRPSATQLLARANVATNAKNTLHIVARIRISVPGKGSATVTSVSDVSLRPEAIHEVTTTSGAVPGSLSSVSGPVELILADGQFALRSGNKTWRCRSTGALPATTTTTTMPPTQISSALQHLTVVGTKTVDGVSAWHITGQLNLGSVGIPGSAPAPVTIYISRADDTIVREVVSLVVSSQGVRFRERVQVDFSRYGEPVSIHLPTRCTLPVLFSIQTIKIDRNNAKPNWSLKRPSLKRVPAGQKVQLSLYVFLRRVRRPTHTYEVERVYRQGRLVFRERTNDLVKRKDAQSQAWYADTFTPWHPGHFRVTATYVAGTLHKHKTVWFWVVRRR